MIAVKGCPRCGKALCFDNDELAGCESGCSRALIQSALSRGQEFAGPPSTTSPVSVEAPPPSLPPLDELLDELVEVVRRFVVMTEHEAVAVALWVVHTHAFDAATATPYLAISSAEKESGKTRLLEVLELLVARPWLTGRVTAAVLPRKIEQVRPTLLLDESDAAFKGDREYAEALRGVLNSGHRVGGRTTVCVGQGADIGFKDFSVFCAKAIAGIGALPDTVESRSIPVRLKRRAPGEQVDRFRYQEAQAELEPLSEALAEVSGAAMTIELAVARPALPDQLGDRACDCWEPLLAIAELAQGDWLSRAHTAALALSTGEDVEDDSAGVRLLADIKGAFGERDRLPTAELLDGLHRLDEAPWGDWFGKPLSPRALARLLHRYGVRSRTVRLDDGTTPKGFLREQFEDPWNRYLPSEAPPKRHNATTQTGSGIEPDSVPPQELDVADSELDANPHWEPDVADVADLAWE